MTEVKTQVFMTDYELAAMKALRNVFTNKTVCGCFFHFQQSIIRNLKAQGLYKIYSKFYQELIRDD